MSPSQIHGCRLESQYFKSGIPRVTPPTLACWFPSLPPILYIKYRDPISGYSEAPWGLSVLPRVTGIFTGTTISPGGLLRQCPDHYTIRAGRNLPDKEFRYLRTVIVTAAVYWGFNSELAPLLLTFQHRAGVTPYTSSYDLAESCVFDKQLPGPIHCGSSQAPLIPKLRGQFAEFLNNPSPDGLRILFLTTCVGLQYGYSAYIHEAFLATIQACFPTYFQSLTPGSTNARVMPFKCVPLLKFQGSYGISTVCASTTPFGLALAPGLTRSGRTFLQETLVFRPL